ncbi:MAG TPA: BTAD domain-containing putative transcriptional regulator [Polyangia bacterium]|jgi:tetratricopeptide (TPR) repeat protein|nr:BTAD domain-containing putative transcriptional regulator [Polyangia bacterium]
MIRSRSCAVGAALLATISAAACAHHGSATPTGPGMQAKADASRLDKVAFEDDFLEGRFVFQALRIGTPERAVLRGKLIHYLLDPVVALNADHLRQEMRETESDDITDRIFDCLRDALGLYDPTEIADAVKAIPATERDLIGRAARLVVGLFSPRGADSQVVLALGALATLDPGNREWTDRLDQLIKWSEEASAAPETANGHRPTSAVDTLESALGDWPAPSLATPLDGLYVDRQKKFQSVLRRPLGGESARKALGELLMAHGEEMQRALASVVTLYLRCGRIDLAAQRSQALSQQPGDDPELRELLVAANRPAATAADFVRLARQFLPRIDFLGGTATDAPDLVVAARVLNNGLGKVPDDPDLLVLSAHVSRVLSMPFLAIRQLEEALAILERSPTTHDQQAKISAELEELYFARLQLRLDPEREALDSGEADALRRRSREDHKRFAGTDFKVTDADIDFELGRSYVNAGQVDKADALFAHAHQQSPSTIGVIIEQAKLTLKRGDPRRAAQILRDSFEGVRGSEEQEPSVVGLSRLQRLLGDAYDAAGDPQGAATAWRTSLAGWEQLVFALERRKNFTAAAEATVEVGRLAYLLGRHSDGIRKFDEALEEDPDREQTYIDTVAFLVENGEADAALNIYHRALSRPSRSVSEYMKVYTSLWVLDLSRRASKIPDAQAEAYLKTLDHQHGEIRPRRGASWYRQLARFAVGKLSYEQLRPVADTVGKQAEAFFYEAMHRLADGRADDASQLWKKVIDTKMFSFFEFDMAARYLRLGAPSAPSPDREGGTETI